MADGTDLMLLRRLVREVAETMTAGSTHARLGRDFAEIGLPEPPGEDESGRELSLSGRRKWSLERLGDRELAGAAQRILNRQRAMRDRRFGWLARETQRAIEEALWAVQGCPPIPRKARRDIARNIDLTEVLIRPDRFMSLLGDLWDLEPSPALVGFQDMQREGRTLRQQIGQHFISNPDWTTEELLDELGAIDGAGDARFARLLEGLVSPSVLPDEPAQRRLAAAISEHLRPAGVGLRESGDDGGYPVYRVTALRAAPAAPRHVIFAPVGTVKPDIRITDVPAGDIEIVTGDVLAYDRPVGPGGLLWRDLQAWWKDRQQVTEEEVAKRALYDRLLAALPPTSPPQETLFRAYHRIHGGSVPGLPALLPEVVLHWDPKTAAQRGASALLRQRMDFLLLLPGGHRVVLEVDGTHHYSRDGRPDPVAYAKGARADRDLKLAGYEVYRFGATELQDRGIAEPLLREFFARLFTAFGVQAS